MRVFLTGATGFIGSRIVGELIAGGHQVLGLTRSDAGARWLEQAGAQVHRGTLEDPASLARGAEAAEAVIHTAFDHDFTNFAAICEKDRRAIAAMGKVLTGSNRPLIITSGVGMGSPGPGQLATEAVTDRDNPNPRVGAEILCLEMAAAGLSTAIVRLPQVHDTVKQGLITLAIAIARKTGVSAYIGDGANRWSAAHVGDVARLYRLALERHRPGACYHAVAEEGIATRDIAAIVGAGLGVPVTSLEGPAAADHFGWFAAFAGMDLPASSAWTRQYLDWQPTGPGLIADLRAMNYRDAA